MRVGRWGRIPFLLSLRELLEQAHELRVSLGGDREPVSQPLSDREPRHHQCRAVRTLLEAPGGLVEQDTVDLRVPQPFPQSGKVVVRRVSLEVHASLLECHSVHDHPRHVRVGHVQGMVQPLDTAIRRSAPRVALTPDMSTVAASPDHAWASWPRRLWMTDVHRSRETLAVVAPGWHTQGMARRKTTLYLDDELFQAAAERAARTGRAPRDVIEEALRRYLGLETTVRRIQLVVSPRLLAELTGVLLRDRFRRYVTAAEVRELVADLAAVATVIRDPPDPVAITRDPNDDYLVVGRCGAG